MSTATQSQSVATRPAGGAVANKRTIKDTLEGDQFRMAVAKVLPKHLTPDRFVRVAIMAMTRTPKLAQCEPASFFQALMSLSQYGLEPDGRRAHLIPFNNRQRNCVECQLIIDYKGLAELVMRSGVVSNIHADVVCENDDFDFDCGEIVRHKINFKGDRGAVYAVYALCRFKDGSKKCDVMTHAEVEKIRSRSRAANNGPWVTDWNEMAKKTVFRRLSKWLPLSPDIRDTIEAEDEIETKRAELARPVFEDRGRSPGAAMFEVTEGSSVAGEEAGSDAPNLADEGEGTDLRPVTQAPAATAAPTTTPAPAGEPVVEQADQKSARMLKAVRSLMKLSGISEVDLVAQIHASGCDDSLGTLSDISKMATTRLAHCHDNWQLYVDKITTAVK